MPMIPQFQGGVPQVQDSGNAGVSPARLPAQTFDYAKVMETAMKPVHEFANSFTKTMEVERARMVKAESDDAERQVITLMNDALLGENGYLKQQGKNADDTYDKSMEGIKAGVDGILGGLSPQAREAVESRVQDRWLSTVTQANRHRFAQRQQYMVGSTKSSLELKANDFAVHWGDAEYQAKTLASIDQDIDYLANIQGWDETQTQAYRVQMHSLAYSSMYQQWANSDPVAAFAGFKMAKSAMDPNVALKIEDQLFKQCYGLLAQSLASQAKSGINFEQRDFSSKYNTNLTAEEEKQFQVWAKENGREKDVIDYDLRGAWKEMQSGQMSEDSRGHLGDKYKKPNHPTFSNQSIYSVGDNAGGIWSVEDGKDVFTVTVSSESEAEYLKNYFYKVEPNAKLNVTVNPGPAWMDDPLAPTGNMFIDSLPDDQRFQITTKAKALFSTEKAQAKQELMLNVENSLSEALNTGNTSLQYTQEQFISVFGPKEGVKQYAAYSDDLFMNKSIFDMRNMPDANINELLEKVRPKRGDVDYAAKQKRHEIMQKAASHIIKARKDDPVGYAISNGVNGYSALSFDKPEALKQQLQMRQKSAANLAKNYGSSQLLLSKAEAEAFVSHLD